MSLKLRKLKVLLLDQGFIGRKLGTNARQSFSRQLDKNTPKQSSQNLGTIKDKFSHGKRT